MLVILCLQFSGYLFIVAEPSGLIPDHSESDGCFVLDETMKETFVWDTDIFFIRDVQKYSG